MILYTEQHTRSALRIENRTQSRGLVIVKEAWSLKRGPDVCAPNSDLNSRVPVDNKLAC